MHNTTSVIGLAVRARFVGTVLLTIGAAGSLGAQQRQPAAESAPTGRIVGRILDATTGQGLTDVGVQIVGTTLGAMSAIEGRYAVAAIPAGTVTIQVRRIGYTPKSVTGILLNAGQTLEQDITMQPATVQLQTMSVTASAERGTVNEALDQQRTATGIVNSVTSEQISRSPDSDAAQAVQRVSGVTVQDGGTVFVRGLGERYTTTQLNGTRMPSPDPERRVVPLDLFPAGLLQTITTSKTFTPDQSGDFSGAQLDIRTREFPARRQTVYSLTVGVNGSTLGDRVLSAPRAGGERLAYVGGKRDLPTLFDQVGNFQNINLNQGDKNLLVSSFRNAWTPQRTNARPNSSTSISVGGNDPILGQRFGYLLSGTYSGSEEIRAEERRALANRGTTPGSTIETDRFDGESGIASVLWGGVANFSTLVRDHTRLMFNNTYTRTADDMSRSETGNFENEGIDARIDRMQYVERSVRSNQLAAEHQFGERNRLDWALNSSAVTRDEPDRSEFVYVVEQDGDNGPTMMRWLNTGNAGAVRTFAQLDETSSEARANYQLTFNARGRSHSLKVGGLYRTTDRDADTRAYAIAGPGAANGVRELRPEQIFDGRFAQPTSTLFDIFPLGQGGAYAADDRLTAGYAMGEMQVSDRVRVIAGARYERDVLTVSARSTLGSPVRTDKQWTDVLPSAVINVKLTEAQQLRASYTGTLARPEYRELAPVKSRDVLNGDDLEGNSQLERTRIQNVDVRWEWYPDPSEVLSFGVFAKYFDDPVERVYRAAGASSRFIGFVNAGAATNYGVEVEMRKGLGFLGSSVQNVSVFSNATVMRSEIDLGDQQAAATYKQRRMVGQAPYVVNAGAVYTTTSGASSATLLFNRVGERIDAAGDAPLPDVITRPRNQMDFSLRFPIIGSLSGRFDARNILDAPYEMVQGTVTREYWKTGTVFQTGLVWRP
jgi:outer membrane receptor protein involved in Fe transport